LDIFTKFHENISELFGKNVKNPIKDVPSSIPRLNTSQPSTTGVNENNRIIERFTKIIHKEAEEVTEIQ
jgi:hypothetical protein